jgi:hypothetical protein
VWPFEDTQTRLPSGSGATFRREPLERWTLERHIILLLRNEVTIDVSRALIREQEQHRMPSFEGSKAVYRIPGEANTAVSKRV